MHVQQMAGTHPQAHGAANNALIRCIEECYACAQACVACADACLGEKDVQALTQCIRLNLDCADICVATGRIATRRTGSDEGVLRKLLEACVAICRACGDECERHAHKHCRVCAASCRDCAEACQAVVRGMRH